MTMQSVKSSHIAEVGHVRGKLRVKFHDGSTYDYADVPEDMFKKLVGADSVGKFFATHIWKKAATRVDG